MADFDGSVSGNDGSCFSTIGVMTRPGLAIAGAVLLTGPTCPTHLVAQAEARAELLTVDLIPGAVSLGLDSPVRK